MLRTILREISPPQQWRPVAEVLSKLDGATQRQLNDRGGIVSVLSKLPPTLVNIEQERVRVPHPLVIDTLEEIEAMLSSVLRNEKERDGWVTVEALWTKHIKGTPHASLISQIALETIVEHNENLATKRGSGGHMYVADRSVPLACPPSKTSPLPTAPRPAAAAAPCVSENVTDLAVSTKDLLMVCREVEEFGPLVLQCPISAKIIKSRKDFFPIVSNKRQEGSKVVPLTTSEVFAHALSFVQSCVGANGEWASYTCLWDEMPQSARLVGREAFLVTLQRSPTEYYVAQTPSCDPTGHSVGDKWIRGNTSHDIDAFGGNQERLAQPDFLSHVANHWVPIDHLCNDGLPSQCRTPLITQSFQRLGKDGLVVYGSIGRKSIMRRAKPCPILPPSTKKWTNRSLKFRVSCEYILALGLAIPQSPIPLGRVGDIIERYSMLHRGALATGWSVLETLLLFPSLFEVLQSSRIGIGNSSVPDYRVRSTVSALSFDDFRDEEDLRTDLALQREKILREGPFILSSEAQEGGGSAAAQTFLIDYGLATTSFSPK